jgi:hypothetical protein
VGLEDAMADRPMMEAAAVMRAGHPFWLALP